MSTGIVETVTKGSKSFQKLNAHLLQKVQQYKCEGEQTFGAVKPAQKRMRQRQGDGMNSWEREWLARITPHFEHIHREVSLPLANGLRYKVDFLCVDEFGVVFGHEVKGRNLPTGIAKIKMAASVYKWIGFRLVTKRGAGNWDVEEVLS